MKKFNDYDKTQSYSDRPTLPKGGYVLKIMDAREERSANGLYIKVSCDIAEGEYADFFMGDYRAQDREDKKWHCNFLLNEPKDDGSEQDGWTKRRFKTVVEALEESNEGYHWDWDEKKWKGLLIGGLFNIRQYRARNGDVREGTNLKQFCSVEKIRAGKFRLPKDDLLKEAAAPSDQPWLQVPEEGENPFA